MKREKIVTEKIVHWSLSLTGQKLVLICSRRGLHRQMFGCVFFVSVNQVLVRLWTRRYGRCLTCCMRDHAGSHIDCITGAVCAAF